MENHSNMCVILEKSENKTQVSNVALEPVLCTIRCDSYVNCLFCITRCDSSVKHYPLTWTGTNYKFGHGEFDSVQDLLHHFQNKPLIGSESGELNEKKFYTLDKNISVHIVKMLRDAELLHR
jgi:hypothetical protein